MPKSVPGIIPMLTAARPGDTVARPLFKQAVKTHLDFYWIGLRGIVAKHAMSDNRKD